MVYERDQEKLDIVKDHLILNRTLRINHRVMKKMKTATTRLISTVTCRFPFPSSKQMFTVISFFIPLFLHSGNRYIILQCVVTTCQIYSQILFGLQLKLWF